MSKDLQVEFVAVKKPRGTIIKTLKDGSTLVRIEMTQDELNATIDDAVRKHKEYKNKSLKRQ